MQAAGDSAEVAEAACVAAWNHAVGDGLRDHAVPLRLTQKTLVVAVADSTWQKQLQSLSGELLFRLNSILGQTLVTFLDFRVDPSAAARARSQNASLRQLHKASGRQLQNAGLTDGEPVSLENVPVELATAAARIQDKDLRRAFLGAAVSCINRLERSEI
ncbi:MAG: DUF721 domain-containing protein [Pyrinomonadaceae bacterium]